MITEHALLPVKPGLEEEFMVAFEQASPLIAATDGFLGLRLASSLETPNHFMLLVDWESLEAHTRGVSRIGTLHAVERTASPLLRAVPGGRALCLD
ncbi:antibiotic biosynthesis monooxygenase [Paeniglutamicibacter antarcticus]|uniref:ABM domain-containing protein n=1 Tax=Paeniglutamicibacter antarcticus TaxID=494023 RepID=A0ABP9TGY4_9MICC